MYDQSRFDALAPDLVPESSDTGFMLLDPDLRVRAVNAAYEAVSMRVRDELIGEFVFDLFPDDPTDPQANGSSQLGLSMESAMQRLGTDHMPILRYDIPDPRNPDIYLPKVWTCSNSSVHEADEQIGVRLRTSEIITLRDALTAISSNVADGNMLGIADQLHTLSALAEAQELRQQSSARQIDQLHNALRTRDILGQAKGMLMERYNTDATAAFGLLRKLSQDSNTRVEVVAERLIELDHPER